MDLRPKQSSAAGRIGPLKDVHRLKTNGAASLGELREFFDQLRGRRPQEVVGIVSASRLIQSVALSCVITAAVLAVFTVLPYLYYGPPQDRSAQAKRPADAAATDEADNAAQSAESPAATGGSSADAVAATDQPDAEKAAKAMGLDETKVADPTKNPLEDNLDSLLDGVD